ncbi:MAG: hypothetical protein V3V08_13915 [Nannocystaceae bacterium]
MISYETLCEAILAWKHQCEALSRPPLPKYATAAPIHPAEASEVYVDDHPDDGADLVAGEPGEPGDPELESPDVLAS